MRLLRAIILLIVNFVKLFSWAAKDQATPDAPRSRLWYVFTALLPYVAVGSIFAGMFVRDLFLPQWIFCTETNLAALAKDCAPIIVAAAGMTLIILTGGIDLSVGSIIGVSSAVAALLTNYFQNAAIGMCAGVVAGLICGAFNGLLVTCFRVVPFIVTLGLLLSLRGVCHLLNGENKSAIYVGNDLKDRAAALALAGDFKWLAGNMTWLPIPRFVLLAVLVVAVLWVVLNYMRLGRRIYAVGSNEEAARLSGVRVMPTKILAYAIGGVTAGIAGAMYASRLGGSFANTGMGEELIIIAAVVIGGTSLSGGQGTISGCVIGAVLMRALSSACTSLRVSDAWQKIIIGMFLVGAVALDRLRREKTAE